MAPYRSEVVMSIKEKRAVILAALSGCMWGSIGLFVHKLGMYGIGSMPMAAGRYLVAVVLVGIVLGAGKRELLKIRLRDLPWFFVTGILCLLFFNVCYGFAIEKSSMPVAAVLLYTSPVIVTLASAVIFREKITLRRMAAVCMAVTGCAFVSGIMHGSLAYPLPAYLWGLAAAVGYASYSIVAGVLLKRYHAVTVLFYSFLTAAAGGCVLIDVKGLAETAAADPAAGLWLVTAAVVCNICPYFCYNLALEDMEASRVAVIASIEPAVASLLGVLVMKEQMDVFGAAGVGMIFAAIVVLNRKKQDKEGC